MSSRTHPPYPAYRSLEFRTSSLRPSCDCSHSLPRARPSTYVTNSKRAFQAQFRRWDFPPKQRPAHANDRLVRRFKELWEKNFAQRDMLRLLNEEESFNIKVRELMRLRARNKWMLRAPNGDGLKSSGTDGRDGMEEQSSRDLVATSAPRNEPDAPPRISTAQHRQGLSKRIQRRRKREATSADGAPSDARFPSETTLHQTRRILGLDPATYRAIRDSFQRMCHQEGVSKKTLAGASAWAAVKARLVQDFPQIKSAFQTMKDDIEPGKLALDVICVDITKRMHNLETRMTLAEARTTLGVNPEESRLMRVDLHHLLFDARQGSGSGGHGQGRYEAVPGWQGAY